ncbi:MAG: oxidoreductase [Bacteroidales bacterium]|nr:MAG: oxidoreductase [Bacteroidales bacterium]
MKKVIKTGIFSYGMSGMVFHAPLLHTHPNFEIKKILQRNSDSSKEKYPYVEIAKNRKDLLDDPEIELIIVNTPDDTHYAFTRESLEANKHVVVEKPFTLTVDEGVKLIDLAKKKKRMLSVFQNRRWDGDFLTVKKVIEEKLLGRLVEYESHFDRYRNYIKDNWKEDPDCKSGTLYNLGSHTIDQALVLFGMPKSVNADIRMLRAGARVDDSFDIRLEYPGPKVTIRGGYLVREQGPRYILHGTEGSFLKSGTDPQEECLTQGQFPDEPGWGTEPANNWGIINTTVNGLHFRGKIETLPGAYSEYYSNIYDVLASGRELIVKPEESLNVIKIIQAAYESNKLKRSIELT